MIMRRDDPFAMVVVPDHAPLKPGTLRQILNDASLSIEQLLRLM
mgnify:CR=1 FL=1